MLASDLALCGLKILFLDRVRPCGNSTTHSCRRREADLKEVQPAMEGSCFVARKEGWVSLSMPSAKETWTCVCVSFFTKKKKI